MAMSRMTNQTTVAVRAGQVFRAKARRGEKRVRIERVLARTQGYEPYAFAHEIDADGKRRTGTSKRSGLPRGMQFVVQLTWSGERRAWVMPPFYEATA